MSVHALTGAPVLHPLWTVPGGRITADSLNVPSHAGPARVTVAGEPALVLFSSPDRLRFQVPIGLEGGSCVVRIEPDGPELGRVIIGRPLATGLHQVDNPAYDGLGRLFATHSGGRDVKVPVPLYRIDPAGTREPLAVEIANPTGFALGPDGAMYVSSRFEGLVYRLTADDRIEVYARDLGVPTGLAFARDGSLFVGDRSGTVFRVSRDRQVAAFASLPASVAAYHLAIGPDDCLYVAAPTLASYDPIYRITPDRLVETFVDGLGRPQGLAFDSAGDLYVVDALAGISSLYRVRRSVEPRVLELMLTAPALIGLAFDPSGGLVVASSDTLWHVDAPVLPLPGVFAN